MLILKKTQHGFSMIEVLISLVVIGVGLLGLAALQLASVKATNNAHSRNIANMLAMEMSDRMRANSDGVMAGAYDVDMTCATKVKFCRGIVECTSTEIASFDKKEIMCGMKLAATSRKSYGGVVNLLPTGSISVERNVDCLELNDGNKHKITVDWSEAKLDDNQQDDDQQQSIEICILP